MSKGILKRVWILRSNPVAPDPRVNKLATTLTNNGFAVSVIAWDRTGKGPAEEHRDNVRIIRYPLAAKFGAGVRNTRKLSIWQWFLFRYLSKNEADFDIIHACDFDTILPALWCKWRYHKKVVYDIFDFYADHLRNTPSWIKSIIRKVDIWAINHADAVIIADDSRTEQVSKGRPRHLTVIYNSPEDVIERRKEQKPGNFTIAYIGLLQIERGIMELLHVLSRHPEWSLELAGFGGDEEMIKKMAEGLLNVHWHGRINYDRAMELSRDASTLIATYDPSIPNHRYSSPNKVFEAMMLGKPIIVAKNTNMDKIIQNANCGIVINYGTEGELENALTKLHNDPDYCVLLGNNARQAYEESYSWTKMSSRLINLYQEIMKDTK